MDSTASSDEGEIRDTGVEKATTSLAFHDGTSVDRQDRTRSRYSKERSPEPERPSRHESRYARDRNRSPYRDQGPRGSKRSFEDDHRGHPEDSRRFKVHYEDHPSTFNRRSRPTYEDLGQETSAAPVLRYDDRDRYSDKRRRTRSRSPYRANLSNDDRGRGKRSYGNPRDAGKYNGYDAAGESRSHGYDDHYGRESRDQSVSKRKQKPLLADSFIREAKRSEQLSPANNRSVIEEHSKESTADEPGDVAISEAVDEATLIEQRRKRREAIKAKYRGSATPMLVQALQLGSNASISTSAGTIEGNEDTMTPLSASTAPSSPRTPKENQGDASPSAFSINNDEDLANVKSTEKFDANTEDDGPSAADYDPTVDMQEDRRRDDRRHVDEVSSKAYDETKRESEQDILLPVKVLSSNEASKPRKNDFDMFAEEDDDMFAEAPETKPNLAITQSESATKAVTIPEAKLLDMGMLDNWDDPEGYYKVILGELLNGRYHVQANLGRGMFSGVVRAVDSTTQKLVAVKVIRNNETMRKAGYKEIEILQKLNEADPDDKKHMIRLERHFEHKGHLCMVFEHLSINLREVLRKFGRDVGINIRAVRAYAQQMFLGLSLMRKCNILHADLKPDNILVNEARNMLKVCDLGSASDASDNEITPYLVSRFYRAPEIILGMQYDFAIDVWSVGCTLYELYTGKILFTGRTNNQMLRSVMECRGKFTTKMLRRAQFAAVHFDDMANFRSVEMDKLTGKDTVKILSFAKPTRDLRTRLFSASKGLTEAEAKELSLFADLLDRCLALNPEKRCTPAEALKHPFVNKTGR